MLHNTIEGKPAQINNTLHIWQQHHVGFSALAVSAQPRYAAAAGTTHYSYQKPNIRHQPGNSFQSPFDKSTLLYSIKMHFHWQKAGLYLSAAACHPRYTIWRETRSCILHRQHQRHKLQPPVTQEITNQTIQTTNSNKPTAQYNHCCHHSCLS